MKNFYLVVILILLTSQFMAQNVPSYVPKDGLVGYWPFNGNANDESGNGNHGTVNGATLTTDRNGIANSAYKFNGVDNWIQIPDANILDLPNNLSIQCWFKANSFDVVSMLLSKHSPLCNNNEGTYILGIWKDGIPENYKINFAASPTFAASTYSNKEGIVSLNSWYQFTITYENNLNILKYYLNGILIDTKNINFDIFNNPFDLFIGKQDCGNQWHFDGSIDDIAIYNRALTPQEISALYTGCTNETATSSNFNSFLLTTGSSVSLSAVPQGGLFTGASIDSNKFVPSKAKIGVNKVKYNFKNSQGCNDSTLFTMIVADTVGTTCKKYDTITVTNNITKYDTVTVKNNVYDTVTVTNNVTKYDTISVTKYDTIQVENKVTKYDTIIVKNNVYDTVKVTNTITKYDTITVKNNIYDTVTVTNTITKYDTVTVKTNVFDTVKVNTYDTITVTNNITKYDTVIVKNNVYDTITLTDTVSILKIKFLLTTGIKANQLTSMSVYPNPTSDVLHIEIGDAKAMEGYRYRILDALGKEVYNELVKTAITEIPLKTLGAAGMYQFEVLDAKNTRIQTNKIVLQ